MTACPFLAKIHPMPEENKPKIDGPEKIKNERDEYLNGWKRAKADLINYQKEEDKRAGEFVKIANAALLLDLIPTFDSFDLAGVAMEKGSAAEKGFLMIKSQLLESVKKYGLDKMKVMLGAPFDPLSHESVGEMESSHPPGAVAEIVGQGYTLHGKVIRPAKVKLASGK